MTSRVFITTLTIVMFGAGYGARIWNERSRCPVPPAPPLLGEISTGNSAAKVKTTPPERPPNAAKIAAEIEQLRPSIEAFRKGIEEMDAEMDRQLIALLKPEQMPLWDKMLKRRIEYTQKEEAGIEGDNLLTAEQIASLQQRPLYKLLAVVVVPQRLEWLAHDLKFDEEQKKKAWDILQLRREKFLTLIDSSPPPSLRLSRLAPLAQRLGEPKK
jgi:hypothetical protein